MPSAVAKMKQSEMNAAAKRAKKAGIERYKHKSQAPAAAVDNPEPAGVKSNPAPSPVADSSPSIQRPEKEFKMSDVEKPRYAGNMTRLTERAKSGVYVKSSTGQLRSNDDLANALDRVPAANVIRLALMVLDLEVNPYSALNVGQQSMNLRNRMRGAIKKGTLTLDTVVAAISTHSLAVDNFGAEDRAARAAARAEKAAAREQEKAAKAAARAEKAAARAAARAEKAEKAAKAEKVEKADKPARASGGRGGRKAKSESTGVHLSDAAYSLAR